MQRPQKSWCFRPGVIASDSEAIQTMATNSFRADMRQAAIYILANRRNGALYTGVTSNLSLRVFQHKQGMNEGFSKRYGAQLVYYEYYDAITDAIAREKQIKAGSRKKKLCLIESMNPDWTDLYASLTARNDGFLARIFGIVSKLRKRGILKNIA
jgi:predicted GIY-YIG superfamily endonuclease